MAYTSTSSTLSKLRKILDQGFYATPSSGAAITGGGNIFAYCSSHGAGDITGAGFFAGVGAQPLSSTGAPHPNVQARSANNVGVRVGDLIVNIESSAGASPARVTWHAAAASTFNGSTSVYASSAGYDVSVSVAATT